MKTKAWSRKRTSQMKEVRNRMVCSRRMTGIRIRRAGQRQSLMFKWGRLSEAEWVECRVVSQGAASLRRESRPKTRRKRTKRTRSSREGTQRMRKMKRRKQKVTRKVRAAMKRKRMLPRSMMMLMRLLGLRAVRLPSKAEAQGEVLSSLYLHSSLATSLIIWGFKTSMMTEWTYNKTTLSLQNLNHVLNLKKIVRECLLLKED